MFRKLSKIAIVLCLLIGNFLTNADSTTASIKTTTITTEPPKTTTQEIPSCSSAGYNGGALFVAIIFGMVLMFGLIQLHNYWLKRRQQETDPNYRAY